MLPRTDTDGAGPAVEQSDERVGRAFRWSLLIVGNLAATAFLGYQLFGALPPDGPRKTPSRVIKRTWRSPISLDEFPHVPFTDVTATAGLRFDHFSHLSGEHRMPENFGSGCAFFDFDNDGHQDIVLINGAYLPGEEDSAHPPRATALYRNRGDGTFQDVTADSGLDVVVYGMGVATGDYDGDGLTDVFVATLGNDLLFRNLGAGKFQDVTDRAGVAGKVENWSTSCGFLDYDRDGWLDLFVCTYGAWTMELDRSVDHYALGVITTVSPLSLPANDCVLFRNRGDGTFEDVSERSGVQVRGQFSGQKAARALATRFCDLDRDGWLDIIVANDLCPAFLFHNRGDGTFTDIGRKSGLAFDVAGDTISGMGVDTADLQGEGDLAIAVTNLNNSPTVIFREQGQRLSYRDESTHMGVGLDSLLVTSWAVFFFDADLDGRPDMFQCNGVVSTLEETRITGWDYYQPCQLFWNCGKRAKTELVLMPVERCGSAIYQPLMGRGAAYADIDGDGDLDILVAQNNGPAVLLRNDQQLGHHWLRVKLRGEGPNWEAIGARIELTAGGRTQQQDVMPTRSYMSQVELPVTFGLGKPTAVETLKVIWPDGDVQYVKPEGIDREILIERDSHQTLVPGGVSATREP